MVGTAGFADDCAGEGRGGDAKIEEGEMKHRQL